MIEHYISYSLLSCEYMVSDKWTRFNWAYITNIYCQVIFRWLQLFIHGFIDNLYPIFIVRLFVDSHRKRYGLIKKLYLDVIVSLFAGVWKFLYGFIYNLQPTIIVSFYSGVYSYFFMVLFIICRHNLWYADYNGTVGFFNHLQSHLEVVERPSGTIVVGIP